MLRGNKALMGIVSNDVKITSEKHKKGTFCNDRDDALACRFYYHGHLKGKRYDICLGELSKEFHLSELVVSQQLMKRQEFLKDLRLKNTTAADLEKTYPHFKWKV